MPDIRDRMEEDKGILKKIQSFIPGFSGYRKREDLRDADKMLRMQLAAKLGMQRKGLEECRGLVVKSYGSKELDMLGGLINHFKKGKELMNVKARINAFEEQFNRRMNVIQGTEV